MALQSKTWATDEVLTASDMNTFVRDNIDFLKSRTINASGTTTYSLSSQSATSINPSFGVTFASAPLVFLQLQVGSNFDHNVNVTGRSTTDFNARIFTNSGNSQDTGNQTAQWIAVGSLA